MVKGGAEMTKLAEELERGVHGGAETTKSGEAKETM